jgi:hypothetical protein
MNLVLDTLKSRRSFILVGHGLGLLATAVFLRLTQLEDAWFGVPDAAAVLAAFELLVYAFDKPARRLKALAPAAFPFKNLAEDDRAFLQTALLKIPGRSAMRALLGWALVFGVMAATSPNPGIELRGSWGLAGLIFGGPVSAIAQYYGNTAMGRRVAPFYYFDGDYPEALSRHMPSLRRRQILWMTAPAIMLLPSLLMPGNGWGLLWCLTVSAAFVAAGLRLFNDLVVSPLDDLGQAVGRLGEGDYSALLDVTSGDVLGVTTNRFNKALRKTDRRFFVREHFGHMVNPDKSEALFDGGLKLDGEEREVAVLCFRIGGPGLTLPIFNKFCTLVVECVEKHGGGVDEISHGLLVALFNAPLPMENPEGAALEAAKEAKERLAVFCSQQRMQAGLSLTTNLGLAYGSALLGLVGPKGRQRYTALGPVPEEARKLSRL